MHGRAAPAQSARVRGRVRSTSAMMACTSGSTIPRARCLRMSRAISLRDIVRERRRPRRPSAVASSSPSSAPGRSVRFASLIPDLHPGGAQAPRPRPEP
jgi:hypothetical protein